MAPITLPHSVGLRDPHGKESALSDFIIPFTRLAYYNAHVQIGEYDNLDTVQQRAKGRRK